MIEKEYSEEYPEFEYKKIYNYDTMRVGFIIEIHIIEFDKFYPQHIFKNIYINNN
jgi:hypothetical protein